MVKRILLTFTEQEYKDLAKKKIDTELTWKNFVLLKCSKEVQEIKPKTPEKTDELQMIREKISIPQPKNTSLGNEYDELIR